MSADVIHSPVPKEVACVRSSIYANMSVWSLFQAYKRIDDDQGKSYELGQSVVIGVRGILSAWMRQAEKVEAFKSGQGCNSIDILRPSSDLYKVLRHV